MKTKPAYYKDIIHSQKRRAEWNNYYGRGTYMITVCKHSACPDFGTLEFSLPENAFIMLSSIGMIIREQVEVTPSFSPEIHIHSYVIMPDHVHILLQVLEPMKHHLGDVIQAIKAASTSRIRKITGNSSLTAFEEGFHDRIITSSKQLEILYRYLRENARRLAVRKARPEFFRRVNALEIGGKTFRPTETFSFLTARSRNRSLSTARIPPKRSRKTANSGSTRPLTAESSSRRSYPRQKKRSAKRPKRLVDASSSSSANRWENATNPPDGTLSCARQGGCS